MSGRGRGAYFKEKYGGGGRGRARGGRGRGGFGDGHTDAPKKARISGPRTGEQLGQTLSSMEGAPYPAYHDIEGAWTLSTSNGAMTFYLDHAQADPYAEPSKCRVRVAHGVAAFDPAHYRTRPRATALADFLLRRLHETCLSKEYEKAAPPSGWAGAKGGQIEIDTPGQQVLERTAVVVSAEFIEVRIKVGLPARGRSVCGQWAREILTQSVPYLISTALFGSRVGLEEHIVSVENQHVLRNDTLQHHEPPLAAFIPDGAVLARASGASDKPLSSHHAVKFTSPPSLRVTLPLHNGGTIQGMGIARGSITVLCGGGYHGKSTLLSALALGCYDHIPGDGREYVCAVEDVTSIRSEDGRPVSKVDISPFINNLPGRDASDCTQFSTTNASGSTSCAASLMESLEMGSRLLLIDEDTIASNFLQRDDIMRSLVQREPITPLVERVHQVAAWKSRPAVVIVCGSSSSFLKPADTVLCMDSYRLQDVTERAKALVLSSSTASSSPAQLPFDPALNRHMSLDRPNGKIMSRSKDSIQFGDASPVTGQSGQGVQRGAGDPGEGGMGSTIELRAIPQLVHASQTRAIECIIKSILAGGNQPKAFVDVLARIEDILDKGNAGAGLDSFAEAGRLDGFLARPRRVDIGAALNRLRNAHFSHQ